MSHSMFESLVGVHVENGPALTVQSLLDGQSLPEVLAPPTLIAGSTAISLDDEDVFQCGKCKKQFTSFIHFMNHKKEHSLGEHRLCVGPPLEATGTCKQLTDNSGQPDAGTFALQSLDNPMSELGQQIILSDSDILSFNIEPGGLNSACQLSTPHMIPSLNVASNGLLLPDSKSINPPTTFNVANFAQPIILTSELSPIISAGKTHHLEGSENFVIDDAQGNNEYISSLSQEDINNRIGKSNSNCDKKTYKLILPATHTPEIDKVHQTPPVLLNYMDGKNCKVLLPNIEYAQLINETGEREIIEYSNVCEGGESNMNYSSGNPAKEQILPDPIGVTLMNLQPIPADSLETIVVSQANSIADERSVPKKSEMDRSNKVKIVNIDETSMQFESFFDTEFY